MRRRARRIDSLIALRSAGRSPPLARHCRRMIRTARHRMMSFETIDGPYRARYAVTMDDVVAAQRLRYEVFNVELGEGLTESERTGLDRDRFDARQGQRSGGALTHGSLDDRFVGDQSGTLNPPHVHGGTSRVASRRKSASVRIPTTTPPSFTTGRQLRLLLSM